MVSRPSELLDGILAVGRKGLSISRYKGLGEMNAEQLWETTLDPAKRILMQVKLDDAARKDLALLERLRRRFESPRRGRTWRSSPTRQCAT